MKPFLASIALLVSSLLLGHGAMKKKYHKVLWAENDTNKILFSDNPDFALPLRVSEKDTIDFGTDG